MLLSSKNNLRPRFLLFQNPENAERQNKGAPNLQGNQPWNTKKLTAEQHAENQVRVFGAPSLLIG